MYAPVWHQTPILRSSIPCAGDCWPRYPGGRLRIASVAKQSLWCPEWLTAGRVLECGNWSVGNIDCIWGLLPRRSGCREGVNCIARGFVFVLFAKYRGADKSLARPGRKQARRHVRDARDFNKIETRAVIKFLFMQGKARHRKKLTPFWRKH